MPNFFYTDANGKKQGPVNDQQLKTLARTGVISPDTPLETDTGKERVAGQISGLKFSSTSSPPSPTQAAQEVPGSQSTAKQFFCTNCGKIVSEQAVACKSCGTKPIGYKKFCHQCGTAINPGQVACDLCGANIAASHVAAMNNLSATMRLVASSSNIAKIKQFPKPAIIAGISVVVVAGIVCLAMFLFNIRGGAPVLTAAERAETDQGIALYGRNVIVHYLGSLNKDKDTDYNLVLKYLKYFVSKGADVNAKVETKNGDGATPLLAAAAFGNVEVVKFLVSKGADVTVGMRGITPLHLAGDSKDKDGEIAKFLVSKGADVNAKIDKDHKKYGGSTPLHVAAEGNIEVVKFLVSKGVDVNAKNSTGQTPLHVAVKEGNVEVVKFLVSKGADVNAKGEREATPLYHAVRMCHSGGNIDPSEREQRIDVIRSLVSKGADVNAKATYDDYGGRKMSPLDLANSYYGNEEVVQILSSGNNSIEQREQTPPRRGDSPQRGGIQGNSSLGSDSSSDVANPDENRQGAGFSGGFGGIGGGRSSTMGSDAGTTTMSGDGTRSGGMGFGGDFGGIASPESDEQEWGARNEQVAANATLIPLGDDDVYFFNSTCALYEDAGSQHEFLYIDGGGTARLMRWSGEDREMMRKVRSVYVLEGWNSSRTFFFITTNNELWAVGNNERGVVGDDTGLYRKEPVLVLSEVANLYFELNLGDRRYENNAVHAIKTDKSRWSWGYGVKGGGKDAFAPIKTDDRFNHNQELLANHISMRNGNAESYPMMAIPNAIAGIWGGKENILSAISLGSKKHILASIEMDEKGGRHYALTQDGVLWGWGNNNSGELGDGTKADRDKPVKIAENVKRILPNYFVTKSNDWYHYSDAGFKPRIAFQNVLYVYSNRGDIYNSDGTWITPDGRLVRSRRPSNRSPYQVNVIIGNIKLPSIVRASDGQVIAPSSSPKQLVAQAAAPNDDDKPVDAEAEAELVTFVKETNFLDACLPKRDKSTESEKMQKLTIGEAFDAVPQFRQQTWEIRTSASGTQTVYLDFVIVNDNGKQNRAKILFAPDMDPNAAARISRPPTISFDGGSARLNVAFFNTMYDEMNKNSGGSMMGGSSSSMSSGMGMGGGLGAGMMGGSSSSMNSMGRRNRDDITTSIRIAAESGNVEAMKRLKEQGTDLNAEKDGWTPMHWAACGGHVEAMKWLREQGVEFPKGLMDAACTKGYLEVMKWIQEQGANVNEGESIWGRCPMHSAAQCGHVEIMKWLKEQGADVNILDKYGLTPMHCAAQGGQVEAMKWLKEQGADINAQVPDSTPSPNEPGHAATPMHMAAKSLQMEAMKWLKEQGVNVNVQTKDGYTPMHLVALGGKIEALEWLLKQGSDINARNKNGRTPLGEIRWRVVGARRDGDISKTIQWLQEHWAKE